MPAKTDRHLTTEEFAEREGISPEAAREWRKDGSGPAWLKLSHKVVRYRLADIEAWEQSRLVTTAA